MASRIWKMVEHFCSTIQPGYTSPESWGWWLREKRQGLPQPWPEEGHHSLATDGSEHVIRFRLLHVDPLEQNLTRQVRLEKWQSGKLIAAEEYVLRENMYLKNELLLMLKWLASVKSLFGVTTLMSLQRPTSMTLYLQRPANQSVYDASRPPINVSVKGIGQNQGK